MKKVSSFLNGKKTFIGIFAGALYSVLIATKVVESNDMVWTAIFSWTGVSFRLAMNK